MPYIKKEQRGKFSWELKVLKEAIETDGELNYVITQLCHQFIDKRGKSYSTLNTVHGVLDCVNKELYRRVTAPYEDQKIIENGDV